MRPPINPRFSSTDLKSKGDTWNIIVVGIRKVINNNEPIWVLFFKFIGKIINIEPKVKNIIEKTNRTDEIGSGIPFSTM